jgi:hypothetical protein
MQMSGASIPHGCFIKTGFVSMIVTLRNGDSAEVGPAGTECALGLPLVFGADQSDIKGMVQCAGTSPSSGWPAGC